MTNHFSIRYFRWILLVMAISTYVLGFSQDASFSQHKFNKIYFNPAYAGYNEEHHVTLAYRNLWPNVPGVPFAGPLANYQLSADFFFREGQAKRSMMAFTGAVGGFCTQDFEGEGHLMTSSVGLSFAQHFPVVQHTSELPRLLLSFGLKAYAVNVRVNWDKFVSSDELSVDHGISGSTSGRTGIGQRWGGDFDFGGLFINNFKGQANWYNEVGFAVAHIVASPLALSGSNDISKKTPTKYTASYRTKFAAVQKQLYTGVTILFEKQANFYELNTGFDIYLGLGKKSGITPLILSIAHRTSIMQIKKNTKMFIVGIGHEGYFKRVNQPILYYLGFAADIPYGGLNYQTFGAYELSLGISISKRNRSERIDCASF